MADISTKIPQNSTLQEVADRINEQNALLQIMVAESMASVATDMQAIKHIVQNGYAPSVFAIGDQIVYDWTNVASGKTYSVPHNLVHFEDVEIADGETLPGMWLQWHYATPISMPFDAREAFYYAEEGLSAGTYYFTMGYTWGSYIIKGEVFEFTLVSDVPAGGQLVFDSNIYDATADGTYVDVYESSTSTEALEQAVIAKVDSSSGADLGAFSNANSDPLNSIQRAVSGYGRWSQSAVRQWLNSSADVGEWWEPQNDYDRPPAEAATCPGFLSGYDSAFLSAIQAVKVVTALNTVTDSADGTSETTYDKVFLPSLEQEFITPQLAGVEGDYWEYWKRACGRSETTVYYTSGAHPKTYGIDNTASAQSVRLRSAYRGSAGYAWCVDSTGYVGHYRAAYKCRLAPACVIC